MKLTSIRVESYSGQKAEETPRRFSAEGLKSLTCSTAGIRSRSCLNGLERITSKARRRWARLFI